MTDRQLDRLSRRVSWAGVLLVALTVLLLGWAWRVAYGEEPLSMTDYERGYATGFCEALKVSRQASTRNRDHFRELLGLPVLSQEEALKHYEQEVTGEVLRIPEDNIVKETIYKMSQGIDWYVVSTIDDASVHVLPDTRKLKCPEALFLK